MRKSTSIYPPTKAMAYEEIKPCARSLGMQVSIPDETGNAVLKEANGQWKVKFTNDEEDNVQTASFDSEREANNWIKCQEINDRYDSQHFEVVDGPYQEQTTLHEICQKMKSLLEKMLAARSWQQLEESMAKADPKAVQYVKDFKDFCGYKDDYMPKKSYSKEMNSLAAECALRMPTDTAAREIEGDAVMMLVLSGEEDAVKAGKKLGDCMMKKGKHDEETLLKRMSDAYKALQGLWAKYERDIEESEDTTMKKKRYTKKQITEAIAYWEKQLKTMNESVVEFEDLEEITIHQMLKHARQLTPGNSDAGRLSPIVGIVDGHLADFTNCTFAKHENFPDGGTFFLHDGTQASLDVLEEQLTVLHYNEDSKQTLEAEENPDDAKADDLFIKGDKYEEQLRAQAELAKDENMKTKYSKKKIIEAINQWKKELKKLDESGSSSVDYKKLWSDFKTFYKKGEDNCDVSFRVNGEVKGVVSFVNTSDTLGVKLKNLSHYSREEGMVLDVESFIKEMLSYGLTSSKIKKIEANFEGKGYDLVGYTEDTPRMRRVFFFEFGDDNNELNNFFNEAENPDDSKADDLFIKGDEYEEELKAKSEPAKERRMKNERY